jgi:ferredoxin
VIYKVVIDPDLCSGYGNCVDAAPAAFRLEGPIAAAVATTSDPRVLDAAAACPMGAILVEAVEEAA